MNTQPLSQILAKIEATRQKAKERQPVELPAVPAASPKVVQLPLWPEPVRGAGRGSGVCLQGLKPAQGEARRQGF